MRVLVLDGAGFVGRHAVAVLLGRQHEVIVGSRYPERAARRLLHVTPFSFGHLQLMQHDNVPRDNRIPQLLAASTKSPLTGKTQEK